MGTWVNDPSGIGQVWQAGIVSTETFYETNSDGQIVSLTPLYRHMYDQAPYPGGGSKYDYAAGTGVPVYLVPNGIGSRPAYYQKLNDGFWYYHTEADIDWNGQPSNGQWDMRRRWSDADMRKIAPNLQYWVSINDPTDHDTGPDLGMLAVFAGIALAGGALSGALAPESASVASAATETTAAEAWATAATETSAGLPAVTEGVTTVGEEALNWYSVDPGPDPFATTADVNAGWSYDGGYPGVDYYNNAGVGEAPSFFQSLTSSAEQAGKLVSNLSKVLTSGSQALAQTRANLAQPAPNYTRAAGSLNLGLLAVAALAWKLL